MSLKQGENPSRAGKPTAEQALNALKMRRAGVEWQQIAAKLGCGEAEIRAAVAKKLRPQHLDEALESDRLDRLHEAIWPLAMAGDPVAIDKVLQIAKARRELLDPAPSGKGGQLTDAFDASVAAASGVQPVDAALIAAGRTIAERVDRAAAQNDGQELTKALYLVPHLVKILGAMGATPSARMVEAVPAAPAEVTPLEKARQQARGRDEGAA